MAQRARRHAFTIVIFLPKTITVAQPRAVSPDKRFAFRAVE